MNTYSSGERMMNRTPYFPDGFLFLNRPRARKVIPIDGGQMHVFVPEECKKYASKIQEYGIAIDQPAFGIGYWDAWKEVVFNTRKEAKIYAAFFEPNDLLRAKSLEVSPEKGKDKVWISTLSRLTTPITDLFNPQEVNPKEEPEVVLEIPFYAYATHEEWKIETGCVPLVVDYVSTIAAKPGFTGGKVIGPALCHHPYEQIEADVVAMRVQNGVAPSAEEKTKDVERPLIGGDVSWDTEPELKEILDKCFKENTLHPNGIDMDKLIAEAVYPEGESKTYIHGKTHGRAFEVTEALIKRGVEPKRGDGAYVAWWVKGKKERWKERYGKRVFAVSIALTTPTIGIT